MSNSTLKMLRDANRTNNGVMRQRDSIGPCCKHFFPAAETSGTYIDDIVAGVRYTPTTAPSFNSDGSIQFGNDYVSIALTSGSWVDLNGKDFLLLSITEEVHPGVPGISNLVYIGGNTSPAETGIRFLVTVGGEQNVSDGTNESAIAHGLNNSNGRKINQAVIGDRSGDLRLRLTGDIQFDDSSDMTSVTGFQSIAEMLLGRLKLYGLALFAFEDGLPDDLETGIDWMADQWRNAKDGDLRLIYPGWVTLK